jgi:pimeloyl-ACP methyl ester carboxylesterase
MIVTAGSYVEAAVVAPIVEMARSVGKDAFLRQQRAMIGRLDSRPFLGEIHCPARVLCGRDDAITPVGVHEDLVRALPDAGLTVIEECGHLSTLERPRQVTEALRGRLVRAAGV